MLNPQGRCRLNRLAFLVSLLLLTGLSGCDQSPTQSHSQSSGLTELSSVNTVQYSEKNTPDLVTIGDSILSDTVVNIEQLQAITEQFLQQPDEETYHLVRFAWLTVINKLERFAIFAQLNFSDANSSDTDTAFFAKTFKRLASWPIEPGYLDGFNDHPYSGLVHDISVPITEDTLFEQHQLTDLEETTLGLYSLGTLLFGPDLKRPMADFIRQDQLTQKQKETGYQTAEELPVNRRRTLINIQLKLIANDFTDLRSSLISNKPEGFGSLIYPLEIDEQLQVIQSALKKQSMQTITSLAEFQKAHGPELISWPQHVYAKRLEGQLTGWLILAKTMPLNEKEIIVENTEAAINALNNIERKPYETESEDKNALAEWSLVFKNLKEISSALNPSAP